MRKTFITFLVIILAIAALTGCTSYTYEDTEIEVTVISCKKGDLIPAPEYVSIANVYLAKGKTTLYTMYMNMARSNGTYNYNITVSIDGENYVIVRSEPYEVGQTLIVNAKYGYANGELVNVEYN